jgi:hypothetical protein
VASARRRGEGPVRGSCDDDVVGEGDVEGERGEVVAEDAEDDVEDVEEEFEVEEEAEEISRC